ncbi:site-specific integrase [Rhodococcus qingshengii]|nr:site-specific integrase [Rhodococcus qingshengii]
MHTPADPTHVRFTGPLAPFAPGFAEDLTSRGYTATSATIQVQLAADLSRWLESQRLAPVDLTEPVIEQYLAIRRSSYSHLYSALALAPLLGHLRRAGAAPAVVAPAPVSAVDILLGRYRDYLIIERALSVPVALAYIHWVHPFVDENTDADSNAEFAELSAPDVAEFLTTHLPSMTRKTAQITACALRSFLRFLYAKQMTPACLADAVPAVQHRRLAGLPKVLSAAEVDALTGSCDRSTPVGLRDIAVVTVLHRLGLRCAECAGLLLDDIDWRTGTMTIHGKGNRTDVLPLPDDVGKAIADYLQVGRPATSARTVFVRSLAPFTALRPPSLSCIVGRAARRAGLGTVHAHRLRHTAASRTLNAGASLEEVAQLLRHASVSTTMIYAKTDQSRLAALARPWPILGGQR